VAAPPVGEEMKLNAGA